MNIIKRMISLISAIFIAAASLTGCNIVKMREDLLSSQMVSDEEEMKRIEDIVIRALEEKDAELLKSIFSEKALARAEDIDRGIEYIFDLYKGEFQEITYENHSGEGQIYDGKHSRNISPHCDIKTTEGTYTLSWDEWSVNEHDPSAQGVSSLQLGTPDDGKGYWPVLGVDYPERYCAHQTLSAIVDNKVFEERNVSAFKDMFTEEALNNPASEEMIERLMDATKDFRYWNIGEGWVNYTESEDGERQNIYIEVHLTIVREGWYIMYYSFDRDEPDKISIFKFTEVEEGADLSQYELGDEITEPGIYFEELPQNSI
ncbi:MAG: DUF5104 domain-containing protein [Eubacterium sp.]